LQTPIASAAEVAEATDADPPRVGKLLAPLSGDRGVFRSTAVWSTNPTGSRQPVLVFGRTPTLARSSPAAIDRVLALTKQSSYVTIIPARGTSPQVLEYAIRSSSPSRYMVYAELALPKPGTNIVQNDPAFENLRYALYLGGAERNDALLFASTADLPLTG